MKAIFAKEKHTAYSPLTKLMKAIFAELKQIVNSPLTQLMKAIFTTLQQPVINDNDSYSCIINEFKASSPLSTIMTA